MTSVRHYAAVTGIEKATDGPEVPELIYMTHLAVL